jgi:hypothetical protein
LGIFYVWIHDWRLRPRYFLFLFILALLWFLLPFAISGTKDKLGEIIAESKKMNKQLARISDKLAAERSSTASQAPLRSAQTESS